MITPSPRWQWLISAARFDCVPEGKKSASSKPKISAARACSRLTVGSSPKTSSPSSASSMARRMAGVGRVTVSERRSTVSLTLGYYLTFTCHRRKAHVRLSYPRSNCGPRRGARRDGRDGTAISHEEHHHARALRRRRADRYRGARGGAAYVEAARPHGHRREQAERRRHPRTGAGEERQARRLYDPDPSHRHGDHAGALPPAALRSAQGLRLHRPHQRRADDADRQRKG